MADYGEPWKLLESGGVVSRDGSFAIDQHRVVSCLNACAGMSDPAAEISALRSAQKVADLAASVAPYARQCGELEARLFTIRDVVGRVLRLSKADALSAADLQTWLAYIAELAERRAS